MHSVLLGIQSYGAKGILLTGMIHIAGQSVEELILLISSGSCNRGMLAKIFFSLWFSYHTLFSNFSLWQNTGSNQKATDTAWCLSLGKDGSWHWYLLGSSISRHMRTMSFLIIPTNKNWSLLSLILFCWLDYFSLFSRIKQMEKSNGIGEEMGNGSNYFSLK